MTKIDYIKSSILDSLDELKITLTDKQISSIAKHIKLSLAKRDNIILNPKKTTVDNLKKKHRAEVKRLENKILSYEMKLGLW